MKWLSAGPKLTEKDFADFTQRTRIVVPTEVRWFLTHITNGGYPEREHFIPVDDVYTAVHGLYGLFHPKKSYDLERRLSKSPYTWEKRGWPIGHNDFDDPLLLILQGPERGQVKILDCYDYYFNERSPKSAIVARDIYQFGKLLNMRSPVVRDASLRTPPGMVMANMEQFENCKRICEIEGIDPSAPGMADWSE